jgi:hypothetical protein
VTAKLRDVRAPDRKRRHYRKLRTPLFYMWTRGAEVLYVGLSLRTHPGSVEAGLIAALQPRYNIITRTCPECGGSIRANAARCDRHPRPRRPQQGGLSEIALKKLEEGAP